MHNKLPWKEILPQPKGIRFFFKINMNQIIGPIFKPEPDSFENIIFFESMEYMGSSYCKPRVVFKGEDTGILYEFTMTEFDTIASRMRFGRISGFFTFKVKGRKITPSFVGTYDEIKNKT